MTEIDGETVTGYAREFGWQDAAQTRAEEHAHAKASEHDGLKAFHVVEVGPFVHKTRETDLGGVFWVVDSQSMADLQAGWVPYEPLSTMGVDGEESQPDTDPARA